MKRFGVLLVACIATGCDAAPPVPTAREDVVVESPRHHFAVDSAQYTLRRDGEGWTTSIGYVFRNPLPDTVSVVNCNGAIVMDLQKHVGDEWQSVWYGMSNGCLSLPIGILPGDSLAGRIDVWAADPGHPNFQTFETADMDGEFRLIWNHLRTHYRGDAPNFGDTLTVSQRTTLPFRVTRET